MIKPLFLASLLSVSAFAQHRATSVIQIHPSVLPISPIVGEGNVAYTPKTERIAITSPEVLRLALESLAPENTKISDEQVTELKKKVSTRAIRGTDFIEITVDGETKKSTTALAKAVTQAFIKHRTEKEIARASEALEALDKELVAQSKLVEKNRKALTALIQKHGIPYFEHEASITRLETLKNAQTRLNKAPEHERFSILAGVQVKDNPVTKPYAAYLQALEKVDFLSQKEGDAKIDLATARKELNDQREDLKKVAQAFTSVIAHRLSQQQKEKTDAIEMSLKQERYNRAKESYEQAREMLNAMKIKQQEKRVLLKMPRPPVTLHESPKE